MMMNTVIGPVEVEKPVYNFAAGPAPLPREVLELAQEEFLDFQGIGASVMEISHRGKEFIKVAEESEQDLRDLLKVPSNYKVLFAQGGARGQFAAIPLNLKGDKTTADFVNSGHWAQSAIKEAQRYLNVNIIADGKSSGFKHLPHQDEWRFSDDAAYVHYTPNETIGGLEFSFVPQTGEVPLVARYVVEHSVEAYGCQSVWCHLRRCSEKHWTRWHYAGDYSGGSAGPSQSILSGSVGLCDAGAS